MSIQDVFYTLASISVLLWIVFLIFLIYVVYRVNKSVNEVKAKIEEKAAQFASFKSAAGGPFMKSAVVMASSFIFRQISKYMKSKKTYHEET